MDPAGEGGRSPSPAWLLLPHQRTLARHSLLTTMHEASHVKWLPHTHASCLLGCEATQPWEGRSYGITPCKRWNTTKRKRWAALYASFVCSILLWHRHQMYRAAEAEERTKRITCVFVTLALCACVVSCVVGGAARGLVHRAQQRCGRHHVICSYTEQPRGEALASDGGQRRCARPWTV
jgi:hypothetical protein